MLAHAVQKCRKSSLYPPGRHSTSISSSYGLRIMRLFGKGGQRSIMLSGQVAPRNLIANGQSMRTVSLPRGRQRLHAMPTSAGYEVRENEVYDWDGRRRGQTPFTVLQHTISGTGRLRYQNRNYRLQGGDTLLVLVPHNHRYWLEKGDRWEYFWISMNGEETLRIHKMVLGLAGPVCRGYSLRPSTISPTAAFARSRGRHTRCGFGDRLRSGDGSLR